MSNMKFNAPSVVKPKVVQARTLGDIVIPNVQQSTRDYFKEKPHTKTIIVPMHIGLEGLDGKVYSIWEVEALKEQGQFPEFKNWFDEVVSDSGNPKGDKYTYVNEQSLRGVVGTHGARNTVEEGSYVLKWDMTEVAVPNQTVDKFIDPNTHFMCLRGSLLVGTSLEAYSSYIRLTPVLNIMKHILYTGKDWYLLPNHEPMSDRKLLSSLKGLKVMDGLFDSSDDRSFNTDIEQAFLAWLASKVPKVTMPVYKSSYLIEDEGIVHKGNGNIERVSPRNKPPLTRPYEPQYHNEISDIALKRAPLALIMDIIMVKGFDINCPWFKKSAIIGVTVSDFGKSLWLLNALKENNLVVEVRAKPLFNTIAAGEQKGSERLEDLYKAGMVVIDEAKSITTMDPNQASNAIKDMASSNVMGDAKGTNKVSIVFPALMMLAADELKKDFELLASNEELDNRAIFPIFGQNKAKVDFADYSEIDTNASMKLLIWDMFYERYNKLIGMTPEERTEWALSISVNEGEFDRGKIRDIRDTYHLNVLAHMVSTFIDIEPIDSMFAPQDSFVFERDIALDKNHNLLINKAFKSSNNKAGGIYLYMQEVLHESERAGFKLIKRAEENNQFGCMAYLTRKTCYMAQDMGKTSVSNPFRIPLCHKTLKLSMEEIFISHIKNEDLQDAFKRKDIIPFLKVISKLKEPNPVMNTIIGRLTKEWAEVEDVVIDTKEGEDYVGF